MTIENQMNRDELISILADDFHDWIDGDDPVKSVVVTDTYAKQGITVTFESGGVFWITVEDETP